MRYEGVWWPFTMGRQQNVISINKLVSALHNAARPHVMYILFVHEYCRVSV